MPLISEEDFDQRFQPETNPDGSLYRQRDWTVPEDWAAIQQAERERRLWTAVDGDSGNWCVSFGFHYVNRLYYIICAVPVPEGEDYWIEDDDQPEEEPWEE